MMTDGASTKARAAHRRDRPPPPTGQHVTLAGRTIIAKSPREDHAVLHQPILEAQLAEGVRSKKAFEARANGGESAMGHEGRAQTCAKDEIVTQRVESLGILDTVLVVLCLLYTSPSPRDGLLSRMPSSA